MKKEHKAEGYLMNSEFWITLCAACNQNWPCETERDRHA